MSIFGVLIPTPENMKTVLLSSLLSIFLFDASIYDFKVKSVEEDSQINLANFKGKKILIVNTASKSHYTYQFEGLQLLYLSYKEKLVVIGFPAGNDFGNQEFKTNKDVMYFAKMNYGVTFPMTEIVSVVGTMRHPIFSYLIEEAKKQGIENPIQSNFTKFLLDENGKLLKIFPADITPLSSEITSYLNNSRNWGL